MNQEIERSYGVDTTKLPDLEAYPVVDIEQVYFSPRPLDPDYPDISSGEWRVRTINDGAYGRFIATAKFGDKASGSRTEIETDLLPGEFGTRESDTNYYGYSMVAKSRYELPDNIVIDFFDPIFHGDLVLAEQEFESHEAMEAAALPDWATPLDKSPSNRELAVDLIRSGFEVSRLPYEQLAELVLLRYKETGQLVVTVSGMSCSGKSTIARELSDQLSARHINTDNFKIGNGDLLERYGELNHDWPHAYDYAEAANLAGRLLLGETVETPEYDFETGERSALTQTVEPANLLILEGLYAWQAAEQLDPKIPRLNVLMATPLYVCVLRRMMREALTTDRVTAYTPEGTLQYLHSTAIPTYLEHTKPAEYFDAVI